MVISDLTSLHCSPADASTPCDQPASLTKLFAGRRWTRSATGESGCAVWRLDETGLPDLYLKHGVGRNARAVVDEFVRLEWLGLHMRVPVVRHFVRDADDAWLLTEALSGHTVYEKLVAEPARRRDVASELGVYLKKLHHVPAAECPFNADARLRLSHARLNIDMGLVDAEDFDEARQGWTPEQVWNELIHLAPMSAESVVTHGDFSTGNVVVGADGVVGCIDVGRCGLADPYQDIAIMWNNLTEYGPDVQAAFLEAYGIDTPDAVRMRFHLVLDELF